MSQSLASAKNRRAGPQAVLSAPSYNPNFSPRPQQPLQQQQTQVPTTPNLTMQQVVLLTDKRLTTLETFMKEFNDTKQQLQPPSIATPQVPSDINEILQEMDTRYNLLADEIDKLKNLVSDLHTNSLNRVIDLTAELTRALATANTIDRQTISTVAIGKYPGETTQSLALREN